MNEGDTTEGCAATSSNGISAGHTHRHGLVWRIVVGGHAWIRAIAGGAPGQGPRRRCYRRA